MGAVKYLSFAFFLVLITTGTAVGADGHSNNWTDFAWRIATFAVVVGVLWWGAGKKLIAFFSKRKTDIVEEFSTLNGRREAAEKELADVERRIADLETERQAILAEYRAQGEQLKAEIIAKAEKSAAQIAEQARRTAQNEVTQAMEAIRRQVAEEVISAAEAQMRSSLSEDEHMKLIDASLNKVVLN